MDEFDLWNIDDPADLPINNGDGDEKTFLSASPRKQQRLFSEAFTRMMFRRKYTLKATLTKKYYKSVGENQSINALFEKAITDLTEALRNEYFNRKQYIPRWGLLVKGGRWFYDMGIDRSDPSDYDYTFWYEEGGLSAGELSIQEDPFHLFFISFMFNFLLTYFQHYSESTLYPDELVLDESDFNKLTASYYCEEGSVLEEIRKEQDEADERTCRGYMEHIGRSMFPMRFKSVRLQHRLDLVNNAKEQNELSTNIFNWITQLSENIQGEWLQKKFTFLSLESSPYDIWYRTYNEAKLAFDIIRVFASYEMTIPLDNIEVKFPGFVEWIDIGTSRSTKTNQKSLHSQYILLGDRHHEPKLPEDEKKMSDDLDRVEEDKGQFLDDDGKQYNLITVDGKDYKVYYDENEVEINRVEVEEEKIEEEKDPWIPKIPGDGFIEFKTGENMNDYRANKLMYITPNYALHDVWHTFRQGIHRGYFGKADKRLARFLKLLAIFFKYEDGALFEEKTNLFIMGYASFEIDELFKDSLAIDPQTQDVTAVLASWKIKDVDHFFTCCRTYNLPVANANQRKKLKTITEAAKWVYRRKPEEYLTQIPSMPLIDIPEVVETWKLFLNSQLATFNVKVEQSGQEASYFLLPTGYHEDLEKNGITVLGPRIHMEE